MLRQMIAKFFGIETANVITADTTVTMQDPCARYLDQAAGQIHLVLGRDCTPGEFVRHAAATPETAAMDYSRN